MVCFPLPWVSPPPFVFLWRNRIRANPFAAIHPQKTSDFIMFNRFARIDSNLRFSFLGSRTRFAKKKWVQFGNPPAIPRESGHLSWGTSIRLKRNWPCMMPRVCRHVQTMSFSWYSPLLQNPTSPSSFLSSVLHLLFFLDTLQPLLLCLPVCLFDYFLQSFSSVHSFLLLFALSQSCHLLVDGDIFHSSDFCVQIGFTRRGSYSAKGHVSAF